MGTSIGLVGLGMFGSAFADMFISHPLVDRVALCDREPQRMDRFADSALWQETGKFARKDMYASLDDILESDLDALVIITQPWLHAHQCVRAMESGKHVYSAVPIITIPDGNEILDWCDKIVDTCRKTGMRYMLGETTYYHPQAMFCRRKAEEGMFGDFVYSEGEYCHDVDAPGCNLRHVKEARLASAAGQEWIELKKSYDARGIKGAPMHYPSHSVSGPMSVMKAHARRVTAYGYKNRNGDPFQDDAFSNEVALFEMSNGTSMRICEMRELAGCLGKDPETFRIVGTKGTFSEDRWICNHRDVPPADDEVEALMAKYEHVALTHEEMRDSLPGEVTDAFAAACAHMRNAEGDFTPTGHLGSHPYLVHEFVDAVVHDRQAAINAWEAVRYMAAGVMAHQSAMKDGERLEVPDWGDAP